MAKLKPIEKLAEDGKEFDVVRIQLDDNNAYVGHIFHIYKDGKIAFSGVGPNQAIVDPVNHLEANGHFYSRRTCYFIIPGYEILRRAKKK